jgi:BirA family biotin operon repressor/biotin-[acetyl-CoA-carboxylase] ligase
LLPSAYRLVELADIDSTNDEIRRRLAAGAEPGLVVRAARQHKGRGRRGNTWEGLDGNLFCSMLIAPGVPPADIGLLSFVTALAVGDAIDETLPASVRVRFKWPNDILIEGRKVAGILLESDSTGSGAIDRVVVGLGVNVVAAPEGTDRSATSLAAHGATVDAATLARRVITCFDHWHRRLKGAGFSELREDWLARAQGLGRELVVNLPDGSFRGRFLDLDATGALIVEQPDGNRRAVVSGEVFFAL